MLRVSADEGEKDPRGEQRRLGVPALLRKIPPGRTAPGQEQEQQDSGGGHSDNKLGMTVKHVSRESSHVMFVFAIMPDPCSSPTRQRCEVGL